MNLTEINSIKDQVAQKHGYDSWLKLKYSMGRTAIEMYEAEAMHLYAESQKPKWISVKDELPEVDGRYLTAIKKHVMELDYESESGWYNNDTDYFYNTSVTHWQPLPEAPLAT